ncbi:MAG: PASTA domain-containing protein [bacterium]|nr:PASTA domain-containing protein [bacterium]
MTWKRVGYIVGLWVLGGLALLIIADRFVLPAVVQASPVLSVPNLAGKDVEFAKETLRALELQVMEPRLQYSEKIPKGRVLSQMPYAGAQVKSGRRIYLTVSRGIETVRMPSVRGLSLRDARLALMRVGLQVESVEFEFNDSVENHRIIAQSVDHDADVPAGSSVTLVISQGSNGVHTPDLGSLTLDEAKAILAQSGLTLGKITYKPTDAFDENSILFQVPEPDSLVQPNTAVHITVASPK